VLVRVVSQLAHDLLRNLFFPLHVHSALELLMVEGLEIG
jgi:hypothetical protein